MRGLFNKNLFNNVLFNTALIIAIAGLFNPAQFQTQPYNTGEEIPPQPVVSCGGFISVWRVVPQPFKKLSRQEEEEFLMMLIADL